MLKCRVVGRKKVFFALAAQALKEKGYGVGPTERTDRDRETHTHVKRRCVGVTGERFDNKCGASLARDARGGRS